MIGAAIRKDVMVLVRDRGALISLFALPIVFMVTFGVMFGGDGDGAGTPRAIGLWHAPGDARGAAIARALDDTPGLAAKALPTADAVRAAVAEDDLLAGLIVPSSLIAPVELAIDLGGPLQVRGPLQAALTGVIMRALAPGPLGSLPPPVVARTPPGIAAPLDRLTSFQVTVPGNAVLFGFFIALTVAMAFASERRTGTWRRLLAAPMPRWHALLATLVPYALVGMGQLAFLFGVGVLGFGIEIAGSLAALIALSVAVVVCAVSLGLLMAAIGGSERQLGGIGSVALLVMGMLGGSMFPRPLMPPFMQQLGLAVPHGWALDGYYAVLVRQGTGVADIAPQLAAVLAFAIAFAGAGVLRFRFEE